MARAAELRAKLLGVHKSPPADTTEPEPIREVIVYLGAEKPPTSLPEPEGSIDGDADE